MPQMQLPLMPTGATIVNTRIHVQEQQDYWYYFFDGSPIYSHHKTDICSFKMFTSLLVCVNRCKQIDIVNSFGVTKSLVSRNVTLYAENGPAAFFKKRKGHGGTVLTKQVLEKAQHLLTLGSGKHDVANMLGIKYDTLRKAVSDGRLSVNPSIAKKTRPLFNKIRTNRNRFTAGYGHSLYKGVGTSSSISRIISRWSDSNF